MDDEAACGKRPNDIFVVDSALNRAHTHVVLLSRIAQLTVDYYLDHGMKNRYINVLKSQPETFTSALQLCT